MNTVSIPDRTVTKVATGGDVQIAERDNSVKQAFQKFVAGTFYQQMFKSLRKMHDKPAYMHGGQAEEMFQNQMDMQVAEDLAAKNGGSLSESLYRAFAQRLKLKTQKKSGTQQPPIPQQLTDVKISRS